MSTSSGSRQLGEEAAIEAQIAALQKQLALKRSQDVGEASSRCVAPINKVSPKVTAQTKKSLVGESPRKSSVDPFKAAKDREQIALARDGVRKTARESRAVEDARSQSRRAEIVHHSVSIQKPSKRASGSKSNIEQHSEDFLSNLKRAREEVEDADMTRQKQGARSHTFKQKAQPTVGKSLQSKNVEGRPQSPVPALDTELSARFGKKAARNIHYGPRELPKSAEDIAEGSTSAGLEPNSMTLLRVRRISSDEIAEHLRGRYVLLISDIYALCGPDVISTLGTNRSIELPIEGEYVVFGVLAHRSPPLIAANGSKFVVWKLVDYKTLPRDKDYASQLHSSSREISLLCFGDAPAQKRSTLSREKRESNDDDEAPSDEDQKANGGGAAFAQLWKQAPGTLVAILNPSLIRQSGQASQGINKGSVSLCISSPDQSLSIGMASDYAACGAMKRDGKGCENWVDKRWGTGVCEFHATIAIQKVKAGRVEFGSGSSFARPVTGDSKRTFGIRKTSYKRGGQENGLQGEDYAQLANGDTFIFKAGDSRVSGQAVEDGFGREAARIALIKDRKGEQDALVMQPRAQRKGPQQIMKPLNKEAQSFSKRDGPSRAFSVHALREIGFDPRLLTLRRQQSEKNDEDVDARLANRKAAALKMKGEAANREIDLKNTRKAGSSSVMRPLAKTATPNQSVTPSNDDQSDSDLELV